MLAPVVNRGSVPIQKFAGDVLGSSDAMPDPQCPHDLQLDSKCNILNDQMFRNNSSADYIRRASKVWLG